MDSELAGFVEQAASIATSGRWDAVNEAVKLWAARPKTKDEMWYGELFGNLCYRVFYEYAALKEAYAAPPPKDDLALLVMAGKKSSRIVGVGDILRERSKQSATVL